MEPDSSRVESNLGSLLGSVPYRLGSIRLDIARVKKFLISFGTLHIDGWYAIREDERDPKMEGGLSARVNGLDPVLQDFETANFIPKEYLHHRRSGRNEGV
jgi:hypothetical protein